MLRLVRVTRILRVFKLVRHFAGLQSLFCTLKQASKELGLLIMLVSVSVLTFSSLVYFSEKEEQNWTFVEAFWWGLLTITTVGYGNFSITVSLCHCILEKGLLKIGKVCGGAECECRVAYWQKMRGSFPVCFLSVRVKLGIRT